ncbi:MAG TPA: HPF/RaiA family ribosome-associated protein [Steroidobacteraceae bacterium]|nr:HPF/RaiA family ribosome-associated protein [Steroidobacteraceae bacterium]
MQVIVNSDHNITGDAGVTGRVKAILSDTIERFTDRIVKVEAFLSDTNGSKHGARDKRCVLEARIAGAPSAVATGEAPTVLEAIEGAATKLERALEHAFGKLGASRGKAPREQDLATVEELSELEKWERERRSR